MTAQKPFWVQIQFKGQYGLIRTWDICEEVDTLEQARSYRDIIDHTVAKARIVDTKTMTVVEDWAYNMLTKSVEVFPYTVIGG